MFRVVLMIGLLFVLGCGDSGNKTKDTSDADGVTSDRDESADEVTDNNDATAVDENGDTAVDEDDVTDDNDNTSVDTDAAVSDDDALLDDQDGELPDADSIDVECNSENDLEKRCFQNSVKLCKNSLWENFDTCLSSETCATYATIAACIPTPSELHIFQKDDVISAAPAGVHATFYVTQDNRMGVEQLSGSEIEIINDESSSGFTEGGGQFVVPSTLGVSFFTMLTIDLSSSIFDAGSESSVANAAKEFIKKMVEEQPQDKRHSIAIYAFGSSSKSLLYQDFTDDYALLNTKIDALIAEGGRGGTNLYGSYVESLRILMEETTDDKKLAIKNFILFSDGIDTAGAISEGVALDRKEKAEEVEVDFTVLGINIDKEEDKLKIKTLASSDEKYYDVAADTLTKAVEKLTDYNKVIYFSHSYYVYAVGICSPVEKDTSSFTIKANKSGLNGSRPFYYDAGKIVGWTGDVSDCDSAQFAEPCKDRVCGEGSVAGFECGTCEDSFCSALYQCINPCDAVDDCGEYGSCEATNATDFTCTCLDGFIVDENSCVDKDECTVVNLCNDHGDVDAECSNSIGSYSCTCTALYEWTGTTCTMITSMATVSGNTFWQGRDFPAGEDTPYHQVILSTFKIDMYEVTNEQYQPFIRSADNICFSQPCLGNSKFASGYPWNYHYDFKTHPVIVTWYGAKAYCEWMGKRLPRESEWEFAARGTDERIYPWGDTTATCDYAVMDEDAHSDGCDEGFYWEVGSKPDGRSPYGLYDMAGNVREWVEDDWHDSYTDAPTDGSAWIDSPRGDHRVTRGGSWYDGSVYQRTYLRFDTVPTDNSNALGFRCASD